MALSLKLLQWLPTLMVVFLLADSKPPVEKYFGRPPPEVTPTAPLPWPKQSRMLANKDSTHWELYRGFLTLITNFVVRVSSNYNLRKATSVATPATGFSFRQSISRSVKYYLAYG
ncbi:hypothetical protein OG21DRAFT_1525918 [Imleria badia]|nr:hypothetical protein OG21DRAFT_1525918 [Imleria badia]